MNVMSNIELWVKKEVFPYLLSGKKTVESRLGKSIYFRQEQGSIILINKTKFHLENVVRYSTFRAMLEGEGLGNVLPMVGTIEEGERLFYTYFTKEQERKFGVAALQVKRILSEINNLKTNNQ